MPRLTRICRANLTPLWLQRLSYHDIFSTTTQPPYSLLKMPPSHSSCCGQRLSYREFEALARALAEIKAGLDEGLPSFCLPILVCMENLHMRTNGSAELQTTLVYACRP